MKSKNLWIVNVCSSKQIENMINHRPRGIGRAWLWVKLEKIARLARFKNLLILLCFSKRPSVSVANKKSKFIRVSRDLWINCLFFTISQAFSESWRISTALVKFSFINHPHPSPLSMDLSARHICIVNNLYS